jgi:hypothetical protein
MCLRCFGFLVEHRRRVNRNVVKLAVKGPEPVDRYSPLRELYSAGTMQAIYQGLPT